MPNSSKNNLIKKFIHEIETTFPIENGSKFTFYPFSNEFGFDDSIKALTVYLNNQGELCLNKSDKIRVSLLTGESNFLSISPSLKAITDVVWFNDINLKIHKHLKIMIESIKEGQTRSDFLKNYEELCKENNIENLKIEENNDSYVGKLHFLYDEPRYNQCRDSVLAMKFVFSNQNLFENHEKISKFIKNNNAILTLANLTNLEFYGNSVNISKSFKRDFNNLVLYSIGWGMRLESRIALSNQAYIKHIHNLSAQEEKSKQLSHQLSKEIQNIFMEFSKYYKISGNSINIDSLINASPTGTHFIDNNIKDFPNKFYKNRMVHSVKLRIADPKKLDDYYSNQDFMVKKLSLEYIINKLSKNKLSLTLSKGRKNQIKYTFLINEAQTILEKIKKNIEFETFLKDKNKSLLNIHRKLSIPSEDQIRFLDFLGKSVFAGESLGARGKGRYKLRNIFEWLYTLESSNNGCDQNTSKQMLEKLKSFLKLSTGYIKKNAISELQAIINWENDFPGTVSKDITSMIEETLEPLSTNTTKPNFFVHDKPSLSKLNNQTNRSNSDTREVNQACAVRNLSQ